jgi:sterol desaturase/sphingolipid hydroxylase (fatty acid hydroxylase superfamily)
MSSIDAVFAHALPLLWLATLIEIVWWRRRRPERPYPWRQIALTLAGWPVVVVLYGLEARFVAAPFHEWARQYRLFDADMGSPLAWIALLLTSELLAYATHRLAHAIPWLWANHAVHHEAPELTLPAGYQLPWLNVLAAGWLIGLPLDLLGFPPWAVAIQINASLVYAYLLHTEMIPSLGPLEGIFNTPSAHRIHHSRRPEHFGRNFGAMLLVYDRLLGTYQAENAESPCAEFGLPEPLARRSLLRVQLHGWARLAHAACNARPQQLPRALFAPLPHAPASGADTLEGNIEPSQAPNAASRSA